MDYKRLASLLSMRVENIEEKITEFFFNLEIEVTLITLFCFDPHTPHFLVLCYQIIFNLANGCHWFFFMVVDGGNGLW